jgi:hypothetical protein
MEALLTYYPAINWVKKPITVNAMLINTKIAAVLCHPFSAFFNVTFAHVKLQIKKNVPIARINNEKKTTFGCTITNPFLVVKM